MQRANTPIVKLLFSKNFNLSQNSQCYNVTYVTERRRTNGQTTFSWHIRTARVCAWRGKMKIQNLIFLIWKYRQIIYCYCYIIIIIIIIMLPLFVSTTVWWIKMNTFSAWQTSACASLPVKPSFRTLQDATRDGLENNNNRGNWKIPQTEPISQYRIHESETDLKTDGGPLLTNFRCRSIYKYFILFCELLVSFFRINAVFERIC